MAKQVSISQVRPFLAPDVRRLEDGMEIAWGIIANVGGGDWAKESSMWQKAAESWRDEYWNEITNGLDRRLKSESEA